MLTAMLAAILASPGAAATAVRAGPVPAGSTEAVLQYDDGTAQWLMYDRTWTGTWFHLDDFCPGSPGMQVESVEFWFFHHTGIYHMIWASDWFQASLWEGSGFPETLLDESSAMAVHYSAAYLTYPAPVETGPDFWFVTELAEWNGSPTPVGDREPQAVPHSFTTDDLAEWEPWQAGDFLYRIHGGFVDLESSTWGAIKGLFM
jgi:hypothetical protein